MNPKSRKQTIVENKLGEKMAENPNVQHIQAEMN